MRSSRLRTRGVASWAVREIAGRGVLSTTLTDPHSSGQTYSVPQRLGGRFEVESVLAVGEWTVLLNSRDASTCMPVVVKSIRNDAYAEEASRLADHPDALVAAIRRLR